MKVIIFSLIIILPSLAFSQEPNLCQLAGLVQYMPHSSHKAVCMTTTGDDNLSQIDVAGVLIIQLIKRNEELKQEIVALRLESQTKDNEILALLRSTKSENDTKQEVWQRETLNSTINLINSMPTELAKQEQLQAILLGKIKEDLLNDSEFLAALRN